MKVVLSKLGAIALCTALISFATVEARAATLDFTFAFENPVFFGGGTVTGVIRGLTDNEIGPAASVEILTNSEGFGLGEYVVDPFANSFEVFQGSIFSAQFIAYGANTAVPGGTTSTFYLTVAALITGSNPASPKGFDFDFLTNAGVHDLSTTVMASAIVPVTFAPLTAPAPIPLPGTVWVTLAGLGALGGLGRLRRRRQSS